MIRVGIVGCGNISGIYLQNLTELFTNVTVYACGDLDGEKARQAAHRWSVPHIMTLEEMLRCDEIDMILNLTTPRTHYKINASMKKFVCFGVPKLHHIMQYVSNSEHPTPLSTFFRGAGCKNHCFSCKIQFGYKM